jgi:hypothetical protein
MTTSHQKEQAERKRLAGSTGQVTNYRDWAVNDIALESRGRHSAAAKATVTGSARVPLYPAASGPWNDPVQVPPEEPLGWSVEAQEPTGNYHEIAESLREAASVLAFPSDADEAREVDATPPPRAAPVEDLVSSSTGVTTPLTRGRKL